MTAVDKNPFNCEICGFWHVRGSPCPVGSSEARENRIEALRAASRVVAAGVHERVSTIGAHGAGKTAAEETLLVAEQFARWLEGGGDGIT